MQDVRETAIFEVEEGDWRLLISHSNWDRNTLQASTADEIIPAA
jgi:hypothetical protein